MELNRNELLHLLDGLRALQDKNASKRMRLLNEHPTESDVTKVFYDRVYRRDENEIEELYHKVAKAMADAPIPTVS